MINSIKFSVLISIIVMFSLFASGMGIFSNSGTGSYEYKSIRGKSVQIYGKGIYHQMSVEVAPQGIAQDYVTFFIAVPMLLISLNFTKKGSLKGKFIFSGVLGYFLVTYLFYLSMAMYNSLFIIYVILLSTSFFAFIINLLSFNFNSLPNRFNSNTPIKFAGLFLTFVSCIIGLLWLSILVPPLLDGTIIPIQAEHYTTLIVQGFDLSILLPSAFISGVLIIKKSAYGYLMAPISLVFLSLIMTALIAKIIAMGLAGFNIIPVVFIIPVICITAIYILYLFLKNIKN